MKMPPELRLIKDRTVEAGGRGLQVSAIGVGIQRLYLPQGIEKFRGKLEELNQRGYDCIAKQEFYEAIVYLGEAGNILE
ncbi:unnamed protein product [Sphagnum balticum]